MSHKYPRIGDIRNVRPQGLCCICKQPKSDCRVDVQLNWFRGEDDVHKIHRECLTAFREDFAKQYEATT